MPKIFEINGYRFFVYSNLPKDKAAALYNLIDKGTIVVVHY